MKATYNKSEIMKKAWQIYKSLSSYTFGECLKAVWATEKAKVRRAAEKTAKAKRDAEREANSKIQRAEMEALFKNIRATDIDQGIANYYASARSGQFMGD